MKPKLSEYASWLSIDDNEFLPFYLTRSYHRTTGQISLHSDLRNDGIITPHFTLTCKEVLESIKDSETLFVEDIGTIRLMINLPRQIGEYIFDRFVSTTGYVVDNEIIVDEFCYGGLQKFVWNWFAALPESFWSEMNEDLKQVEIISPQSSNKIISQLKGIVGQWRDDERLCRTKKLEETNQDLKSYYEGREVAMAYCQGQIFSLLRRLDADIPHVIDHDKTN